MKQVCTNILELRGSRFQLEKCIETVSGENGVLDFSKIIPRPNSFSEKDDAGRVFKSWSDWERIHWRSESNAIDCKLFLTEYRRKPSIKITFKTLERAPYFVVQKLAEMFPLLKLVLHTKDKQTDVERLYAFSRGKLKRVSKKFP